MMMDMEAMMVWGVSHSSSSSSLYEDAQFGGWRKGPWTPEEDKLLSEYVSSHGEGRWSSVARSSGLKRSGKSCRLRWVNYLRPGLKKGHITPQEEGIIIELHALWGNKWSTIARYLPGRTDNEIKNYWRTHFKKKKPQNKTPGQHKQDKRKVHSMTHHQLQQQQQPPARNHPMTNAVQKEKEHAAEAIWEPVEDGKTLSHQNPVIWSSEFITGDEDVLWGGLWDFVDPVPEVQPPVLMDCNKMAMQQMQSQASSITNGISSGVGKGFPCTSDTANRLSNKGGGGGCCIY